ncbi:MAG: ribose 1,5-bisphosphate isomerase [archaeon]
MDELQSSAWKKFYKVLEDIKNLKIQGAKAIGLEGIKVLSNFEDPKDLKKAIKILAKKSRPTEPYLRNLLNYFMLKYESYKDAKVASEEILKEIEENKNKIINFGANRVQSGFKVLVHCHSSFVVDSLIKASETKDFEVFCTETRPLFQGRITAKELSTHGIKTTMIVDSAARFFMNDIDLVLVGCDAITSNCYFINKIGTSQIALAAEEARTTFEVISSIWKYDPKTSFGEYEVIESRSWKEIWSEKPKKVNILNPAFDLTPPKYVKAFVCEEGVLNPNTIDIFVKQKYPWFYEYRFD